MSSEAETAAWYAGRRATKGERRDDVLRNPGVLFQARAMEAALTRTLGRIDFQPTWSVLDVGGGSGGSLLPFMAQRVPAAQLASVEIRSEYKAAGEARFPGVRFYTADGAAMPFRNCAFDVVYASTMFGSIADDDARHIGTEMRRVARRWIVIRDWTMNDPRRRDFKALTRRRFRHVFGADPTFRENGPLVPPLGRFLSAYAPWLYFAVPFPIGGKVYALRVG